MPDPDDAEGAELYGKLAGAIKSLEEGMKEQYDHCKHAGIAFNMNGNAVDNLRRTLLLRLLRRRSVSLGSRRPWGLRRLLRLSGGTRRGKGRERGRRMAPNVVYQETPVFY